MLFCIFFFSVSNTTQNIIHSYIPFDVTWFQFFATAKVVTINIFVHIFSYASAYIYVAQIHRSKNSGPKFMSI